MTVDYQNLQINGVRVETYGTPSAARGCLVLRGIWGGGPHLRPA